MSETNLYRELAERTGGSFLFGVVGPVRTGKSSFIKRFMETLVIPNIEDPYSKERARDELPQSSPGRTIMTVEPKFVPEEAVQIRLPDGTALSVRLIDCVGYMAEGAAGQFEDGTERMVTTPWFDREVTMTEAAEAGTEKVIRDHSSVGIVITADGSFGELGREAFLEPEERVIRELQELGKPFALVLNSAEPDSERARSMAAQIEARTAHRCLCMNCLEMNEDDLTELVGSVLEEFPLKCLRFSLPDWLDALPAENELKRRVLGFFVEQVRSLRKIGDLHSLTESTEADDSIGNLIIFEKNLGQGTVSVRAEMPRSLYYETLSTESGLTIRGDGDLIEILSSIGEIRREYESIRDALHAVRETGYGVVYPADAQMELAEPQIVRQNGRYCVRLRATAPAIHLMMTKIETEVTPAIGGERASEDIIGFLLQGFDGDASRLWESNIFGKSLNELAGEGLRGKIDALPESARRKLRDCLQRMINESCSGLLCLTF